MATRWRWASCPQGISNPFYSRLLKGVEQGLRGTAYYPLFASGEQPAEEALAFDMLLSHRVEALILMGGQIPTTELADRAPSGCPSSPSGAPSPASSADACGSRTRRGLQGHPPPLGLGHRRIAHITGLPWHPDAIARRAGYERALAEAGIAPDPALIVEGDFEEQSGLAATEKLLPRGVAFTAIFAGTTRWRSGPPWPCSAHGLQVPRDVSVVGFDDQPSAAYTCPPLTTIRQPAVEMGAADGAGPRRRAAGPSLRPPTFQTELVVRGSTARPTVNASRRSARRAARRSRPPRTRRAP